MPLSVVSTYSHLQGVMTGAYALSKATGVPDPDLDLQGAEAPRFSNHSLRRHSDKNARENMEETGVTKQMIDCFFGWLLKEMMRGMQLHYSGEDRPTRRRLARVSMMM